MKSVYLREPTAIDATRAVNRQAVPITSAQPAIQAAIQDSPGKVLPKADWSESIQAVLKQPPSKLATHVIGVCAVFSGFFITWAYVGQMQEVSHAQGKLIPQGNAYKIQPVIQGRVDSLFVKEGDVVQQGQVLMSLDASLPRADASRLDQALDAAQKELAQMRSLIEQTTQENAAYERMAAASTLATQAILQQSQSSIATSEALLMSLESEMGIHQERLDRISALESQGAVSKEYVFGIEQGIRERSQTITQNQGQRSQSIAQARRAEADIAQSQAEAQQITIAAQQSLQKLRIEAQQLQSNINDLQAQREQAETKLAQSDVRSSIDGVVSALDVDNIGEVVQPGQRVAEIVPENTPLILAAVVPHQEAGLLRVGLETQIKMDAFPYQNYGVLSGKVISISPNAISPSEAAMGETSSGYRVNISLNEDFVMHEQQAVPLQIGQTASAEIVTRRRRIIEILTDPIRQLKERELSL